MIHSPLSNGDVLNEKSKTEEIVAEVFASYHCSGGCGEKTTGFRNRCYNQDKRKCGKHFINIFIHQ